MIVDTSAVLAIMFGEPDAHFYDELIAAAPHCRMSAASLLEATIVLESRIGARAVDDLDVFLEEARTQMVPVTLEQVQAARRAWRRFGKGNHPARLNFGDCFSYALAEVTGEPLLFKGNDFALTDVEGV